MTTPAAETKSIGLLAFVLLAKMGARQIKLSMITKMVTFYYLCSDYSQVYESICKKDS
jgi:hypothetical protein